MTDACEKIDYTAAWNGSGLPPVGTECEYRLVDDGINDWFECVITYRSKWLCVALCDNGIEIFEQSLDLTEATFRIKQKKL